MSVDLEEPTSTFTRNQSWHTDWQWRSTSTAMRRTIQWESLSTLEIPPRAAPATQDSRCVNGVNGVKQPSRESPSAAPATRDSRGVNGVNGVKQPSRDSPSAAPATRDSNGVNGVKHPSRESPSAAPATQRSRGINGVNSVNGVKQPSRDSRGVNGVNGVKQPPESHHTSEATSKVRTSKIHAAVSCLMLLGNLRAPEPGQQHPGQERSLTTCVFLSLRWYCASRVDKVSIAGIFYDFFPRGIPRSFRLRRFPKRPLIGGRAHTSLTKWSHLLAFLGC